MKIEELNDAHKTLKDISEKLSLSNSELENFAYAASHDLQEPLRKILIYSSRLEKHLNEKLDHDVGLIYVNKLNNTAHRMRDLISGLLSLSRVSKELKYQDNVDLSEILTNVLEDLEVEIEASKTTIQVDKLPTIRGDAVQLRRLLQNLIGNSIKFRHPDVSPVIKITTHVVSARKEENHDDTSDSHYLIQVVDNGIGFNNEHSNRIFEAFQRLHGKSEYDGSGLGLSLCRKIVELHNGSIHADGNPGYGACFNIKFPI